MIKLPNKLFFPADDFGSEHDAYDDEEQIRDEDENLDDEEEDNEDDEEDDEDDEEEELPPSRNRRQQAPFNETAMASALAAGLKPLLQQQQSQQHQQQPQKTLEELIGKTKVSKEFIKQLRDPEASEEAVASAFEALLGEVLDRSVQGMGLGIQGMQAQFQPHIERVQQYMHQQEVANFTKDVLRKYPALRGHTAHVQNAMSQLAQQGFNGSRDQAIKAVAIHTRDFIRTVNANFSLKAKKQGLGAIRPRAGSGRGPKSSTPNWMKHFD